MTLEQDLARLGDDAILERFAQMKPLRVETPSFKTAAPQLWHDSWRNADRIMRYRGACVVCRRKTYAFDDGENDPRGILGNHASHEMRPTDFDDPRTGRAWPRLCKPVPVCAMCGNDYDAYHAALAIAEERWRSEEDED